MPFIRMLQAGLPQADCLLMDFSQSGPFMILLEPAKSLAYLSYLCYRGASMTAFRITKERRVDRAEQKSERNVFHCFVFGPKKIGKSALLNSFLGRPFFESYASTPKERFAAKVVNLPEVHWDMGVEPPLPICTKLGHLDSLFQRLINAAEHPHLNIPEREAGRSLKLDSDQLSVFICAGWVAAVSEEWQLVLHTLEVRCLQLGISGYVEDQHLHISGMHNTSWKDFGQLEEE